MTTEQGTKAAPTTARCGRCFRLYQGQQCGRCAAQAVYATRAYVSTVKPVTLTGGSYRTAPTKVTHDPPTEIAQTTAPTPVPAAFQIWTVYTAIAITLLLAGLLYAIAAALGVHRA